MQRLDLHHWRAALALAMALSPFVAIAADPYPGHTVRMVVPYSVGGGTDVLTRPLAQFLGEQTGHTFLIDNKPGADAAIGVALVAKAAPDGYTLVAVSGVPFLLNQYAYKDLPYDTLRDLVPVAMFSSLPMLLVSSNSLPVNDAKGLVTYAKQNPKKLNYAGTDQMTYLGMEMIAKGTGTEMTYIPYKGAGPALSDLLGDHIQLMLASVSSAIPFVKDGRMKALAIAGSKRSAALPAVPTIDETIYPGYELTAWFGVFAPAGTPPAIVEKLSADIAAVTRLPAMQQRLDSMGADVRYMGPAEFHAFLQGENARWGRAFKESGLRAQ